MYFLIGCIFQTLTSLDLRDNHIGALGVQYLGEALQMNRVGEQLLHIDLSIRCILSYRY